MGVLVKLERIVNNCLKIVKLSTSSGILFLCHYLRPNFSIIQDFVITALITGNQMKEAENEMF